ncbi:hypothetical protein [Chryseobacterium echinoideorum]|uniref:hypothetical protein n=1 Tax=Chryseobacterium echinoideorum TaxID=1549648 RepID=UPI001185F773|nr:hypothetical protein [Chryseobacterium echinoideorum]
MKKLITILIILLISACTSSRQKSKEKQESFTETDFTKETKTSVTELENSKQNSKDSVSAKTNYTIVRDNLLASQNFQLKNNGKCADPGTIRNVEFTDAFGNRTTIPVNDNTELNFINETDLKNEIESLKLENNHLFETSLSTQRKYEDLENEYEVFKQNLKSKSVKTDTKTEKNTVWQFALVAVLAVIVWETSKKLIKRYIP